MAGSKNLAILIGHLGRDPEVRRTNSGDAVANLSVATSEKWRDKNSGERKEKTEWHRCSIWGPAAEFAEKYLRKGSLVYVEGKLETRKWTDQSGVEKFSTEIVVRGFGGSLQSLDSKSDNSGQSGQNDTHPHTGGARDMGAGDGPKEDFRNADLDDEIPF